MAMLAWLATAAWLGNNPDLSGTHPYGICLMLWSIASLTLLAWAARLVWIIIRRVFRFRIPAKEAKPVHHIVTQALRVPSQSPRPEQIIAALTGLCGEMPRQGASEAMTATKTREALHGRVDRER